eukprot:NODE_2332_length_1612_cov_81.615178_g2003_i0.p1 GENE.NODE_2332_length_1612_cov_81.615178_g2003_i0~~NODE_2332_length_1612_cov_81.615178_g2003_i0.p1  ORF type:complete len:495 (+),score=102.43 NODE_2332_length_1612_cov_81.615178_g2003_i0:55-1485(+)
MSSPSISSIIRHSVPQFQLALKHVTPTEHTALPNRFKIASQYRPSQTCTVGVWINAGSGLETKETNGTAHFLEHLNFKGTAKRTKRDLEYGMEKIGAHLNAYTSREHTCYYIKCLKKDVNEAVDVLADILLNSKRTDKDIESERSTILQEKEEVESRIDEVLMDHLHSAAFELDPLGLPILGSVENIKSINQSMVSDFVSKHYVGGNMVLVGCGGIEHGQLVDLSSKYFGGLPEGKPRGPKFIRFIGSQKQECNDYLPQSHYIIGFQTPGSRDVNTYYQFRLIEQLLGSYTRDKGEAAYSCFTRAIVADFSDGHTGALRSFRKYDHNMVHSLQALYTPYADIGIFGFYVIADSGETYTGELTEIMHYGMRELIRLTQFVSDEEFERAKNQLKVQIMVNLDGTTNVADDIGRQVLWFGAREPLHVIFDRIDKITKEDIVRTANEYFYDKDPVLASIGNSANLPTYETVKRQTFSIRL